MWNDIRWLFSFPLTWVACGLGAFLLLLFSVAVTERRITQPYVPARRRGTDPAPGADGVRPLSYSDNVPDPSQLSDYVVAMSDALAAAGFEFGGILAHAKVPQIQTLGTVWWSPDRRILALTSSGSVLRMPARQTWLFTRLADGRVLVTTDNNDEGDPSNICRYRRILNVRMDTLLPAHGQRVREHAADVVPFDAPTPTDALFAMYKDRVDRMVGRRLARYADDGGVYWHHTGLGGLLVCLNFFRQLAGAFPQAWRVNRKPIAPVALNRLGTHAGFAWERAPSVPVPPPLPASRF